MWLALRGPGVSGRKLGVTHCSSSSGTRAPPRAASHLLSLPAQDGGFP